jgi:hypothetical protein
MSDEWFAEKAGKPSASSFCEIVTTKGEPTAKSRRDGYLFKLAGEAMTGMNKNSYMSQAMKDGVEREPYSRALYSILEGVIVEEVGVVYPDEQKKYLCSPDGLINRQYGLELKNVIAKTQAKRLMENRLPTEYFTQIQGSLLCCPGLDRWDFFSCGPEGLPPFHLQIGRDEPYLLKLKEQLDRFCYDLAKIIKRLKEM